MTHPFHPLHGREFALVDRRNTWGEDRVYFHDEAGVLKRLPTAWTSAAAPNPFDAISAGRSAFRVEELLQLVALISRYGEVHASAPGVTDARRVK